MTSLESLLEDRAELVRFVRARVESDAAAEEIVQAAFLRGVEHGAELDAAKSAVGWFHRVLRNAIVDHYRRRSAASRARDSLEAEPPPPPAASPDDHARTCACVRTLARGLKAEYAAILEQVDIDERAVTEVAASEGLTANNATVRLHRARRALRERVLETCGACATHGCVDCTCKHEPRSGA